MFPGEWQSDRSWAAPDDARFSAAAGPRGKPLHESPRPARNPVISLDVFNLADLWEAVADRVPDRVALRCGEQCRTYAQLEERSNRLAHWYLEQGIRDGRPHRPVSAELCRACGGHICWPPTRSEPCRSTSTIGTPPGSWSTFQRRRPRGPGPPVGLSWTGCARWSRRSPRCGGSWSTGSMYEGRPGVDGCRTGTLAPGPQTISTSCTRGVPQGFPKGVVWRQEDAFFACMGGGNPALPEVTSVGAAHRAHRSRAPAPFCSSLR